MLSKKWETGFRATVRLPFVRAELTIEGMLL